MKFLPITPQRFLCILHSPGFNGVDPWMRIEELNPCLDELTLLTTFASQCVDL